MNEIGYEDEKQLQENFENQLILELKKVEYFLLENLKYYKTRLDKIKVNIFLLGSIKLHKKK